MRKFIKSSLVLILLGVGCLSIAQFAWAEEPTEELQSGERKFEGEIGTWHGKYGHIQERFLVWWTETYREHGRKNKRDVVKNIWARYKLLTGPNPGGYCYLECYLSRQKGDDDKKGLYACTFREVYREHLLIDSMHLEVPASVDLDEFDGKSFLETIAVLARLRGNYPPHD